MSMKSFITVPALAGAIAATMSFAGAGAAAPNHASPGIGMEVLDMMCVEQGGQAFTTPFTISRCQEARRLITVRARRSTTWSTARVVRRRVEQRLEGPEAQLRGQCRRHFRCVVDDGQIDPADAERVPVGLEASHGISERRLADPPRARDGHQTRLDETTNDVVDHLLAPNDLHGVPPLKPYDASADRLSADCSRRDTDLTSIGQSTPAMPGRLSSSRGRAAPAMAAAVVAAGFAVNDGQPLDGFDRVYVSDPFGNRIELMQPSA